MIYFLGIIFGVLPSVIWLFFYLRKDAHPESNSMVLRVFFYGMLVVIPTAFVQYLFLEIMEQLPYSPFLILNQLIFVALIEEVAKYLVFRWKVFSSPELDEPLDVMLYMIIGALGFAALENIFYSFKAENITALFMINIFRFIGAVFGHALWAGVLGYFLALSFYYTKERLNLVILGFTLAILSHTVFNYAIFQLMETENLNWLFLVIIMLIGLAIFLTFGFKKLQKMKSVCKIN